MIETYIYSSCTSCRKTEAKLRESGVPHKARDFFRDRLTHDELAALLARAELTPRDILSRRSKVYQTRRAEIDALDDDRLVALMIEEPTLIRRPLVFGTSGVIVGHNEVLLGEMIEAARALT